VLFFALSLDEAAGIHELVIGPLRSLLNASGVSHYGWVLPAVPVLVVLIAAYSGFLRHLPRDSRLLFLVAGALYVIGVIGIDMAAGYFVDREAAPRLIEFALTTVEELVENVGIVTFIYALLFHIRSHLKVSQILLHLV
jgi:hypothetical protein